MWKEAKVGIGDIEARQCFTSVIHIIILEGNKPTLLVVRCAQYQNLTMLPTIEVEKIQQNVL